MATGSIYGLMPTQGKGKFSLQSTGNQVQDEQLDPSVPGAFTSLPAGMDGKSSLAPVQAPQIQAANIPQGFQFTGTFDAENRGLQQQESDLGLKRTNSLAAVAEQYLNANRKAEQQNVKGRRALFANLADKGALGSGMALEDIGDYTQSYNDYINELARSRAYDMSNIEADYASGVNNLGRQREGLVSRQQQYEEQQRLEQARLQAEAERAAREEEMRRQQIEQMIAAQEAARQAAEAAAEAARNSAMQYSYSAPSFGGIGYGGGGGFDIGGGGGSAAPANPNLVLPHQFATSNVPASAVNSWLRQNVDSSLTDAEAGRIAKHFVQAGANGLNRDQLAAIIKQDRALFGASANVGSSAMNAAKRALGW